MPHDSDDLHAADNATRDGRGPVDHPTMLSACARAATAEEARYRVEYPNAAARRSRIFALDPVAAEAMYGITEDPWNGAHFLTLRDARPDARPTAAGGVVLAHPDGMPADLEQEIHGADVVVLIAATGENAAAAETIAARARARGILCAGLALAAGRDDNNVDAVVNSMRRATAVLVVARDNDFIPAMLTALRA